jgi:alpha-beta hydrolase superfamily lysophospholipase
MMEALVQLGTPAFRLDFSKNGTTAQEPSAIVDTEAWSQNTYSREVKETIAALGQLKNRGADVVLMGHSRGGGIATCATAATLNTGMTPRALVLLASVSDFHKRFPSGEALQEWKESDCLPIENARTGETYCHRFQFYQDFINNAELLDIRKQAARITVPVLAVHSEDDPAVEIEELHELTEAFRHSTHLTTRVLKQGGHTFGAREPWPVDKPLPNETAELTKELGRFIAHL